MEFANRNSLPIRKNRIYCACRDSRANAETNCCCCGLAPRIDAPSALHCALGPGVRAHCLPLVWRRRDVPSVLESTSPGILCFLQNVTDCWLLLYVVYEYVSTEKYAPSALLLVSRPEPGPADCSLATERRAACRLRVGREATSICSYVTIHLIDRSGAAGACLLPWKTSWM